MPHLSHSAMESTSSSSLTLCSSLPLLVSTPCPLYQEMVSRCPLKTGIPRAQPPYPSRLAPPGPGDHRVKRGPGNSPTQLGVRGIHCASTCLATSLASVCPAVLGSHFVVCERLESGIRGKAACKEENMGISEDPLD